jgi:diphosphomevalonate decarboxylase
MFTTNDFIPTAYSHNIESGEFLWTANNIALVKYWGKGQSNSANPSVSFTLNNCKTITKLTFAKKKKYRYFSFDLLLKEKKKISSQNQKFLERIEIYLPFLKTIILQSTHKIRSPQF